MTPNNLKALVQLDPALVVHEGAVYRLVTDNKKHGCDFCVLAAPDTRRCTASTGDGKYLCTDHSRRIGSPYAHSGYIKFDDEIGS